MRDSGECELMIDLIRLATEKSRSCAACRHPTVERLIPLRAQLAHQVSLSLK